MNKLYNEKKISTLSILYFFSYVSFSIVMTNLTPFLTALGYDIVQRGIILSGYAITTIVFQLLFGIMADRYQTIKKVIIVSLLVFGIASAIFYKQNTMFFILHLLLVAVSVGLLNTCCGLLDTWVLSSGEECKSRLSFIKAFGSIGWALASFGIAYIVALFSYRAISISLSILIVLIIVNIKMIPDIQKVETQKKPQITDIIKLLQEKYYALLVLILFLMYSIVVANNGIVIDKMIELGATNSQISLKWTLQSLLEIPTYLLGYRILIKYNHYKLLRLSAIVITIQFILFSLLSNITIMILLNLLQVFSTPLILIVSKVLIYDASESHLKSTSQLVALSIFTGFSSFIIPILASIVSTIVGINLTLLFISSLGLIAFILIFKLQKISTFDFKKT